MKSEFHEIRSVIEAHSRSGTLGGVMSASACGLMVSKGAAIGLKLRVTVKQATPTEYTIDRWD